MLHYLRALAIIVVAVLGLNNPVHAAVEPGLHNALAQWISDSTKGKQKVSVETAVKYVREAYVAAEKWGIDPLLILAYIKAESNYQANARNKSGASGLMQIIPKWHRDKIVRRDIMNYKVNMDVGGQIIHEYLVWHRENFTKAMNMYSGGAGHPYRSKIAAAYRELRDVAFGWRMDNDVPVIAEYRYTDPRRYNKNVADHAAQLAKAPPLHPHPSVQLAEVQQDSIYAAYLMAVTR